VSRVQCRDCNMEVVVDPTGRCPEGHLVGVAGERIAGSIGEGPRHPDEPEPWVGRVVIEDDGPDEPVAEVRSIRPPSLAVRDDAPVADDTGNDGLLSEFASLGEDPGPAPRSRPEELASATDLEAAVHQLSGSVEAPAPPAPSSSDDASADLDELEHFTPPPAEPAASNGHHGNGHAPAPAPVSAPSPAAEEEEDDDARWQALADVAALAKDVPEPSLRFGQASATSSPSPAPPPPPAAPPAAETRGPERGVEAPRGHRDDRPGLDMASFTAHGTKVGGRGRRRRFGR
jgi:hypothetical protein